jgi:hypothetical protein
VLLVAELAEHSDALAEESMCPGQLAFVLGGGAEHEQRLERFGAGRRRPLVGVERAFEATAAFGQMAPQ